MQLKEPNLLIALLISLTLTGCSIVESVPLDSTSASKATSAKTTPLTPEALTKAVVPPWPQRFTRYDCVYDFQSDPAGYVIPDTLRILSNNEGTGTRQCARSESDEIHMGHRGTSGAPDHNKPKKLLKRILLLPQELASEGSCRWCYPNSAGGMSCVTYNIPGNMCPYPFELDGEEIKSSR